MLELSKDRYFELSHWLLIKGTTLLGRIHGSVLL